MKNLKRVISLLLALAMAFCFCSEGFADNSIKKATVMGYDEDQKVYEVVVDNAPVRSGASKNDSVLCRLKTGTLIVSSGSTYNKYLHEWIKVVMNDGATGYIYCENVEKHSCYPTELRFGEGDDEIVFEVCSCGKTTVKAWSMTALGKAKAVAGGVIGTVGAVGVLGALGDWPLVVGLGGVYLAVVGICMIEDGVSDKKLKEIDWVKLADNNANYCSADSIHMVKYEGGRLVNTLKSNKSCLGMTDAYVYGYCGGMLWVRSAEVAKRITTLTGGEVLSTTINGYSAYAFADQNGYPTGGYVLYGGAEPAVS